MLDAAAMILSGLDGISALKGHKNRTDGIFFSVGKVVLLYSHMPLQIRLTG